MSVDSYKLAAAKNVNIAMAHRSFCTGLIFNSSTLKVIVAHSLPAYLTLWQRLWPHPSFLRPEKKSSKKYGGCRGAFLSLVCVVASDKIIFFNPIICQ
jgi:hypothetical protein